MQTRLQAVAKQGNWGHRFQYLCETLLIIDMVKHKHIYWSHRSKLQTRIGS